MEDNGCIYLLRCSLRGDVVNKNGSELTKNLPSIKLNGWMHTLSLRKRHAVPLFCLISTANSARPPAVNKFEFLLLYMYQILPALIFLKQIQSCFYSSPTFVFSWSLLIFYTDRQCIYLFVQTWSCPSAKLSVFTIMPVLCEFVVHFYCALFSWLFPMARRKRKNSRVYSAWTSTCLAPNRPSKCFALSVRILFPYKVPVLIQRELFLKLLENHLL